MAPNLFRILLAVVALYAFLRGSRDERIVGVVLVVGVIATHFAWTPVHQRFAGLETDNRRERANDSHRLTPAHASTRP